MEQPTVTEKKTQNGMEKKNVRAIVVVAVVVVTVCAAFRENDEDGNNICII